MSSLTVSQWSDPPCDSPLKNPCEGIYERSESLIRVCGILHSERLKLFSLDHQQPVCVLTAEM